MLTLQNEFLKVVVRPDLGGRIEDIFERKHQKSWIWHPEGYKQPQQRDLQLGASYDDNWSGGFDEIFPNDAACEFQGRSLPVHGELWSQAWEVKTSTEEVAHLQYVCQTMPVVVEKEISINPKGAGLALNYTFRSTSKKDISFLFKLHPAISIEPGDEIKLPECEVKPVDLGFSDLLESPDWQPYPDRLSKVPALDANAKEFLYARNLKEGWCRVYNPRTKSTLKLSFETRQFPFLWLFQLYGGWKKHFALVIEPSTTMPWDLEDADKAGTIAVLPAGAKKEYSLEMSFE